MIKIKNLTKVFKSKNKETTIALKNVSFELPSKGFVFIVGKSGSGKTTLLNMIAAVDNYNKGEIIVDGLSLNKLKGSEFDYYRNKNIGFIFQDYQLLDELTVFQNVKVALNFINDNDDTKVFSALESVGLKGFENRYPRELSGGEKQRVAIARAIVKDPSIILADEPTGNLDTITSKEILNILKEISKNKTVLIVSHNIFDAHEFASMILELSYGELIGTYKRNDKTYKSIEVCDGILRLPLHKDFLESEKAKIIQDINNGVIDVIQDDQDFLPIEALDLEQKVPKKIEKRHISFKNAFKLGIAFLRKSVPTILTFAFIISALFGIIYSSEIVITTDVKESLMATRMNYKHEMITLTDLERNKDRGSDYNSYFVNRDSIQTIKDRGYEEKIYPAYGMYESYPKRKTVGDRKPFGFVIADDEYFSHYTDKLDFWYEDEVYKKEGIYITDYLIDCYNTSFPAKSVNYEDVNDLLSYEYYGVPHFNGVINTHYKEKYPDMYETIKEYHQPGNYSEVFQKLDDKLFDDFVYDLGFYARVYSFEENYFDYLLDSFNDVIYINNFIGLKYKNKKYYNTAGTNGYINTNFNALGDGEYRALTGKDIHLKGKELYKLEEPIKVQIESPKSFFADGHSKTFEITISYLFDSSSYLSSSVLLGIKGRESIEEILPIYEIILKNNDKLQKMFKDGDVPSLLVSDMSINAILTHHRLSSIFNKIFKAVIILLFLAIAVSLVFFSIYIVKKNVRNIGILKSLGGRSKDILIALSLNIILTSLLTSVLYVGFSYLFLLIIEKILLKSFETASLQIFNIYNFKYLINNPILILINAATIVVLLILSSLIIFYRLNKYKPTELIKGAK